MQLRCVKFESNKICVVSKGFLLAGEGAEKYVCKTPMV